jgi:glycerate 2-kinase
MSPLLRVLVATDSFKGSASAPEVAAALADGWRQRRPRDEIRSLPLADGGEGTMDVVAQARPGARLVPAEVSGPDGRPVSASWLSLPDGGALVELAVASGLPLLRAPAPMTASTVGLGQLIVAAMDAGVTNIDIGLGGSASTDGGTGALWALGARFLDHAGNAVAPGGGHLEQLARIDRTILRAPPQGGVRCLVDVTAPLLGPDGAASRFGPQKGATPTDVARLEDGLTQLARVLGGRPDAAGAGAAGGTGYGLAAAWGAELTPGAAVIAALVDLDAGLNWADVVITGEGRFDRTSLDGKVVGHLAERMAGVSAELVLVAGDIAAAAPPRVNRSLSLTSLTSGQDAIARPRRWLREAAQLLAGEHGEHAAVERQN